MCHQTVGLIARQLEAAGIATLSLTSARDITRAAWPPRAAFLDYPLGHTSGRPNDPEINRSIMVDALRAFETIAAPGTIVDLPYRWADDDAWKDAVMVPDGTDDRVERHPEPQYQTDDDIRAAEASHHGLDCLVCAGIDY